MWNASKLERFEAVEPHMGTLIGITIYRRNTAEAAEAFRRAYARIAELNRKLSDYLPDSEVNQITTRPQRVSDDLYRVLRFAQTLSDRSGGAFDVTIGPLTKLWRKRQPFTPEARALVNWRELKLEDGRVWFNKPGMQLDLGAIGKGYAADEAAKLLQPGDVLVAASGDIVCRGKRDWRVQAAGRTITLRNAAVSTSGDANQPGHILDPRTGQSMTTGLVEVSVIAANGMTADALATTVRILGREAAAPLLRHYKANVVAV